MTLPRTARRGLPFTARNLVLIGAGLAVIAGGYAVLAAGHATPAAVLLVVGYCVLLPVGIAL
ncbi:MAG: hypothetical protein NW201_12190 [Gemmatimonadales bacterium]|nr:hypothetical protein [Gemmatimonadales bacterium]